jgi:tRNA A-37 threonylcarbamoyl transferase component Bud32
MPMAPELDSGSELAGFRVDRLIAAGGMGAVYLAHDATLRRRVALKVVAPALADDKRYRNRFLAEARLAASLEHPSIVPIYAAGESDGRLYLAMRFLEDGSLADLLAARGRLAPPAAIALLEPLAAALDAAHGAGLVHRDVKPGNVLLDGERALLADFGLAVSARAETLLSADASHLNGTMGYLAPEQIEGERPGPAADQYAFACVAFECLTGRRPFPRDSELAVIYAHISEPPPSAADLVTELPRALDRVLARGLAKRPADRYPTCREFVHEIAEACGVTARPVPLAVSRRRRLIMAGAVAAVAVGGVAIGLALRSGRGPAATPAAHVAPAPPADGVVTLDAASLRAQRSATVGAMPLAFAVSPQSTLIVGADRRISLSVGGGAPTVVGAAADEPVDAEWAGDAFWMTTRDTQAAPFAVGDHLVRIDPTTGDISTPLPLPPGSDAPGMRGKQLASQGDLLWVVDPDGSVERVDGLGSRPTLRREIGYAAEAIASGDIGVWALGARIGAGGARTGRYIWRVDGPTGAASAPLPVEAASAMGLAVGAGAVWVADPLDGWIHRIRPGPISSTITVGRGVDSVSFDDGRLWAANSVTGELWTIDPVIERRTRVSVTGRAISVEARSGKAAAATLAPTIRTAAAPSPTVGGATLRECSAVETAAGRRADVILVGDFPVGTEGADADLAAIRATLQESGYRAGRSTVGFEACRSTTSIFGDDCERRAAGFAAVRAVAVVVEAGGGDCVRTLGEKLYPAGVSVLDTRDTAQDLTVPEGPSYSIVFRVVGSDLAVADGQAAFLRQLHVRRVFILAPRTRSGPANDATRGSDAADAFDVAAHAAGMDVVGRGWLTVAGPAAVARAVRRSGADGVVVSAPFGNETAELLIALRSVAPSLPILTRGDLTPVGDLVRLPRSTGIFVSSVTPAPQNLSRAGRRWLQQFALSQPAASVPTSALAAAAATKAALAAIGRSNGTRSAVFTQLYNASVPTGYLPGFAFNDRNELAHPTVPIWRIVGSSSADPSIPADFLGATYVTTMRP